MQEKDRNEFAFMSEQYKKKPFYKKKLFQKGVSAAALAIIFGTAAGFTFSVVQPWAEKQFGEPEDPAQIIVVQEETETEEVTEAPQTEETSECSQTIVEKKELEIEDYKRLHDKMAKVAESVLPSVVTVTGQTSRLDWFNEVIEDHVQDSGLVIAQNQEEYFILTGSQAIENADNIMVTFADGGIADGALQKSDSETGLAVVRVQKSERGKQASGIASAELSATSKVKKGEPVIALGNPTPGNTFVSFGMITSIVDTPGVDSQYKVLSTDILGNGQKRSVLIDLDGNIVGIVSGNFSPDNGQTMLTALASSDIQELVSDLANDQEWAWLGIVGKEIDEKLADEFNMPQGIYVREVAENSPAMYAGVYEADIIQSIDGEEIHRIDDYEKKIHSHSPNERIKLGIRRATIEGYANLEIPVELGRR